jgi:membrane-bound lytic murein transglycosylase B
MTRYTQTRRALTLALSASLLAIGSASAAPPPETAEFIDEMVQKHQMDRAQLETWFEDVELRQDILDAISSPAEGKPWYKYRPIFVTQTRIKEGVKFWKEHRETLDTVAEKYGVPPQIMVGIVGVETRFGRHRGGYRVLDSLYTLGMHYPPRAKFFRSELEQFLLLAKEEALDPVAAVGSYAGAMGQPQFISSSYRNYAVDFDGDGKRDLFGSPGDILGSVANYFVKHGWQPGEPVALPVKPAGDAYKAFISKGLKPDTTLGNLAAAGVEVPLSLPRDMPARLLEFEGKSEPEHWIGLKNFYVITRYNHSALYAMAVYQLSEAVRKQLQEETS